MGLNFSAALGLPGQYRSPCCSRHSDEAFPEMLAEVNGDHSGRGRTAAARMRQGHANLGRSACHPRRDGLNTPSKTLKSGTRSLPSLVAYSTSHGRVRGSALAPRAPFCPPRPSGCNGSREAPRRRPPTAETLAPPQPNAGDRGRDAANITGPLVPSRQLPVPPGQVQRAVSRQHSSDRYRTPITRGSGVLPLQRGAFLRKPSCQPWRSPTVSLRAKYMISADIFQIYHSIFRSKSQALPVRMMAYCEIFCKGPSGLDWGACQRRPTVRAMERSLSSLSLATRSGLSRKDGTAHPGVHTHTEIQYPTDLRGLTPRLPLGLTLARITSAGPLTPTASCRRRGPLLTSLGSPNTRVDHQVCRRRPETFEIDGRCHIWRRGCVPNRSLPGMVPFRGPATTTDPGNHLQRYP